MLQAPPPRKKIPFVVVFVCGAGIEPRTSCMLSTCCISELHPQPLIPIFNQIQKPLGDGRINGLSGHGV